MAHASRPLHPDCGTTSSEVFLWHCASGNFGAADGGLHHRTVDFDASGMTLDFAIFPAQMQTATRCRTLRRVPAMTTRGRGHACAGKLVERNWIPRSSNRQERDLA